MWSDYHGVVWEDEAWIEIDKVLSGKRVIRILKEFKQRVKWKEMVWKSRGLKGQDERKGRVLYHINAKVKGMRGFLVGLADKEIRREKR